MTDYYEPTLLFRQNAIRRFNTSLSPIASVESLALNERKGIGIGARLEQTLQNNNSSRSSFNRSSWLLRNNHDDKAVLSQACSLDRLSIQSNYWKIPDTETHMTAMDVSKDNAVLPTLALASGGAQLNLFIYEYDDLENFLVHHKTISLPHIHAMQWAPNSSERLLTGNNKGYAHLVTVPGHNEPQKSAEILLRLNHRKYLRTKRDTNVLRLGFCGDDVVSVFSDHLFRWELGEKAEPVQVVAIDGLVGYDMQSENTVGICGKFGVAMHDLREEVLHVSQPFTRTCTNMRFNPCDTLVFAASFRDGAVKLFDVRNMSRAFSELRGHAGHVTALEWSDGDVFTGAYDGNIVHWDLRGAGRTASVCELKEGLDSVRFNGRANTVERIALQRQCGTVLPASNTNIVSMASVMHEDGVKVLLVDGSSFFGVHSKIHRTPEKAYYLQDDLRMMSAEESAATLVEGELRKEEVVYVDLGDECELVYSDLVYSDLVYEEPLSRRSIRRKLESLEEPSMSSVSLVKPLTVNRKEASQETLVDENEGHEELHTVGSEEGLQKSRLQISDGFEARDDENTSTDVELSPMSTAFGANDTPSPRFDAGRTRSVSSDVISDDFDFGYAHDNGSGYSVQSEKRVFSDSDSSMPEDSIFNDSMDTLSTVHTLPAVLLMNEFKGALTGIAYEEVEA